MKIKENSLFPWVYSDRSEGLSLLEITISLSLFAIVILASGETLLRGVEQSEDSFSKFQLMLAIENKIAEIQDIVNQPNDYSKKMGVSSVYAKYEGTWSNFTDLPNGKIYTRCFADENTVPAILGGPQDLNYDNDSLDNLQSSAGGLDLKLIPMYIYASYVEDGNTYSYWTYRLITKTAE